MTQALSIWSELEQAYYGDNAYGGDTAEIYAYRLQPADPKMWLKEFRKEAWERLGHQAA